MSSTSRRAAAVLVGVALVVLGLGGPSPSPAAATDAVPVPTTDRCGDAPDARQDLRSASVSWTATSFAVAVTACSGPALPRGDWLVSVHLTGSQPELQVHGTYQDLGSHTRWSGLRLCRAQQCAYVPGTEDFLVPPGTPLEGSAQEGLPTASGYAAWVDALPGAEPPTSLQWYAQVRSRDAAGGFTTVVDRVPDSGLVPVTREPGLATQLRMANYSEATAWSPAGAFRSDVGALRTAGGAPVRGRRVRVLGAVTQDPLAPSTTDSSGDFRVTYWVRRNTVVQVAFGGDGVHEPARSATYTALVRAQVTLDAGGVQGLTVRRSHPAVLRGVVRPRASGAVQVHVRPARGGSWRLLRTTPLRQGRSDSWYTTSWTPVTPGAYQLRTVWRGGTSAPGGVLNGVSQTQFLYVRSIPAARAPASQSAYSISSRSNRAWSLTRARSATAW